MEQARTQKEHAQALKRQKEEAARMKSQVDDLEMKARYWKAQHDIRFYTLAAEELQDKYNEYLEIMKQKNEELQAKFQEQMEKLKEEKEVKVEEGEPAVQ